MNRKKMIPLLVIGGLLLVTTLYFEIFRHIQLDRTRIRGSGTIEVTEIEISSKIAGRVIELPRAEGAAVKKGDLICRLDYDELNAQRLSVRASLANAQRNIERVRRLYETGSVSKRDFDNAETAYRVARANHDRINASIGNAVIYAPIDGIVLETNLEPGETAFPSSPVLTLAELSRPWIKIYVSAVDLARVKLGQRAEVFIDAYPDRPFPGTVIALSNKAEFTPKTIQTKEERVKLMFAVKIAVQNPELIIKPGMPADAIIFVGNGK